MDSAAFRRHHRYDDEANSTAYVDNDPFYIPPSEDPTAVNSFRSDGRTYNSHRSARGGGGRGAGDRTGRDLMSMQRVFDMTAALQKEQEDQEAREKGDSAGVAERMRDVRNARWEAVKERMSLRAASLRSVRAYDSDCDSEEDEEDEEETASMEMKSVRTTRLTALDALAPSLSEERAIRRGAFHAVETMPQRFSHFVYNWFMFFVYAFSATALPGMDIRKGSDRREYFDHRAHS
ncbi:hypothetical protein NESM_000802800 [Novymonas esmeraldas]|uniref:Uncharacterized protein n=1 Tax=Novymonas esmeraldas TaxID=1808958 RepID=A0AAW0EVV9_9TRYP